jgi:hypothetical protein
VRTEGNMPSGVENGPQAPLTYRAVFPVVFHGNPFKNVQPVSWPLPRKRQVRAGRKPPRMESAMKLPHKVYSPFH